MGLGTTHGCWSGPYSYFGRWREAIAHAAGIADLTRFWRLTPCSDDELFGRWAETPRDPLHVLLLHSDCDGVIQAAQCGPLADALEELIPRLANGSSSNWADETRRFVAGLRLAAARGEDVEFH